MKPASASRRRDQLQPPVSAMEGFACTGIRQRPGQERGAPQTRAEALLSFARAVKKAQPRPSSARLRLARTEAAQRNPAVRRSRSSCRFFGAAPGASKAHRASRFGSGDRSWNRAASSIATTIVIEGHDGRT